MMDIPLQFRLRAKHWNLKEIRKAARIMRHAPSSKAFLLLHWVSEHLVILSGLLIVLCALLVVFPLSLVLNGVGVLFSVVMAATLAGILYGPLLHATLEIDRDYHIVLSMLVMVSIVGLTYLLFGLFDTAVRGLGFVFGYTPLALTGMFTIAFFLTTSAFVFPRLRYGRRRLVP